MAEIKGAEQSTRTTHCFVGQLNPFGLANLYEFYSNFSDLILKRVKGKYVFYFEGWPLPYILHPVLNMRLTNPWICMVLYVKFEAINIIKM